MSTANVRAGALTTAAGAIDWLSIAFDLGAGDVEDGVLSGTVAMLPKAVVTNTI
jgi:hypothetical protein